MFTVTLSKKAGKDLDKLSSNIRKRTLSAIDYLRFDPYTGKKLKGDLSGSYVVRVWPYRIIYDVYKKELIVYITKIQHRQGVYK